MKSHGLFITVWVKLILLLWLVLLLALGASIVLFFAGFLVPAVTVRTVVELWPWTGLALALGVVWVAISRRRAGNLLRAQALRAYGWSTLLAVSLVVLYYLVERWRGHHDWLQLELELQGESLELRSIEPPPVPDPQNFAAIPLVKQWWEKPPTTSDEILLQRLITSAHGAAASPWSVREPVDLEACLAHYFPAASSPPTVTDQPARRFLLAWRAFDSELEQLQAGAERPYARFALPYDRGHFDHTLGRKLTLFHAIGAAFQLRAVAYLRNGESGAALADVQQLIRVADLVGQEPILERQQLALLNQALQPVWEGLAQGQWSDTQLAELYSLLMRPRLLREQRRTVHTEILLLIDLCEKLFPVRSTAAPLSPDDEFGTRLFLGSLRLLYPSGWLLQNQVGLCRLGRQIRQHTVAPEEHRVFVDETERIGRQWLHRPPSLDPFFATFIMPRATAIAGDATLRYAYAQAALDLAATACALERYRLARGQFPDQLDALVPNWIGQMPTDLIDGRPLRYRRAGPNQFLLYSVGWNQTDDGGQIQRRPGPSHPWEDSPLIETRGDWVWECRPLN